VRAAQIHHSMSRRGEVLSSGEALQRQVQSKPRDAEKMVVTGQGAMQRWRQARRRRTSLVLDAHLHPLLSPSAHDRDDMALNWAMLEDDRLPVPLPHEMTLTTIETGGELTLVIPDAQPTGASSSGGKGGSKKLKETGQIWLTDQRVRVLFPPCGARAERISAHSSSSSAHPPPPSSRSPSRCPRSSRPSSSSRRSARTISRSTSRRPQTAGSCAGRARRSACATRRCSAS
jgi:hypothetical protein